MTLNQKVFNTEKVDYEHTSLFLGEDNGLLDSVNKQYPEIWRLYKLQKAQDWDESEFDFSSCARDFQTCSKSTYDMMIKTLAWQWEADSIAARNIAPVVAPFITSSELWAAWLRVSDNEAIHALTYSEIVRNSFENPSEVIAEILAVEESFARLEDISKVFADGYVMSHKLALGQVDKNSQEVYNAIFMLVIALWCLERIKFVSSFAVTFSICETGLFAPIGKAVMKIAADEFDVHCELDRAIMDVELQTERGKIAFTQNRELIKSLIDEVVESEKAWTEYLFSEERELVGVDKDSLFQWVLYCAKELYQYFGIESEYELPEKNPLKFMDSWLNLSKIQASPQEEKIGAYFLGAVVDTAGSKEYDLDF